VPELWSCLSIASVLGVPKYARGPVIDAMSQAALAAWFKSQDRQTLKHAIENEETPEERAKRLIRERGQSAVNRFWEVRSGDSPW
jgi:hypothetical protein